MYRTIFSGMCTAVMGNIWRICVQFPWQSSVRNGIINVEIYHYRGQAENGCFARERGQLVVCLCLKAPREFLRGRPLPWVAKSDGYIAWHRCSCVQTLYIDTDKAANTRYSGLLCDQRWILFMPESTEGVEEGQTTAMSGKKWWLNSLIL